MKKIIFGSLLVASSLFARDSITLLPYGGTIDYDSDAATSAKNDGTIKGIYGSIGNLGYLFELDYSATNITYKDSTVDDLEQSDITVAYSTYYDNFMLKGGLHHISTTDTDLDDGNTLIMAIGGYNFVGYDKHSYGLETYFSRYSDGHDDAGNLKSINVAQFTPYYKFYNSINTEVNNNLSLKLNYINASNYDKKTYTSYEIEDTIYYKQYSITAKAYGGKMKSGVKDGGFTVYNSKDLLKDGYSLKLGYNVTKQLSASVSYAKNNFEEYGMTGETSNKVLVGTLSYTF